MDPASRPKSNSNKSNAKIGKNWMKKLYFDPEADNSNGMKYDYIPNNYLMFKLKTLVGANEKIIKVWTYKSPLYSVQLTSFVFHHRFVVFQTDTWWWSIEKHSDGITIQRSNQFNAVVKFYRQKSRNSLTQLAEGEGKMGVYNLIEWLYFEDELCSPYNYISNNCKHFADRVFEQVKHPVPYEELTQVFTLELGNTNYKGHSRITAEELMSRIKECEEMKEDINIIRMCSPWKPLLPVVICETKTRLWCIEETSNITEIYRFDSRRWLINEKDDESVCFKADAGKMRMYDLMEWLCKEDTSRKKYPAMYRSCDVFNHVKTYYDRRWLRHFEKNILTKIDRD